ncbi:MAG: SDR family oxidoreductase [Acidobacteria bacterium]|nr:SDR family oxidoreductase [Acidobacteriota bacterium]
MPIAFVTGATGLLGNNLVRLLLTEGWTVRALARSREKAERQFDGLEVEVVEGDLGNVSGFAKGLEGADVLFHTAAYFRESYQGGSHWGDLYRINVQGTSELLEAAYRAGIRRAIHTSSVAILDGAPGALIDETMRRREEDADDYYRSKIQADSAVDKFLSSHPDFWAAFVLPGWMHGPGDIGPTSAGQMVLDFLHRRLPGIVPGNFSFVDARDVARAQLLALENGRRGERYLAAGRNMTVGELCIALENLTKVPAPTRKLPFAILYLVGALGELQARLTGKPALLSMDGVKLMKREQGRTNFNHAKSIGELKLRFRPVEETLRDEVKWYCDNGYYSAMR